MNDQEKLFRAAGEIQFFSALLLKFFNQALDNRLRQHGADITALQHAILGMLMFETITISMISQRLGMDPSTLVRSVDGLERKGLVVRGRDSKDRRRNPISITEQGRELLSAVPAISPDDQPFKTLQSLGSEKTFQLRDRLRDVMNQFPEGRMIIDLISGSPPEER